MKISMGAKKYDLNHAAKAVLEKVTAAARMVGADVT
jgi:hypothetical protein